MNWSDSFHELESESVKRKEATALRSDIMRRDSFIFNFIATLYCRVETAYHERECEGEGVGRN